MWDKEFLLALEAWLLLQLLAFKSFWKKFSPIEFEFILFRLQLSEILFIFILLSLFNILFIGLSVNCK